MHINCSLNTAVYEPAFQVKKKNNPEAACIYDEFKVVLEDLLARNVIILMIYYCFMQRFKILCALYMYLLLVT